MTGLLIKDILTNVSVLEEQLLKYQCMFHRPKILTQIFFLLIIPFLIFHFNGCGALFHSQKKIVSKDTIQVRQTAKRIDTPVINPEEVDPRAPVLHSAWIDSIMNAMSLRDKIAQMVVPFTYSQCDSSHLAKLKALIRSQKVGGIIVSKGSVHDAVRMIDSMQSYSKIPLLISADFESGAAMRLQGATEFPSNMALGATRNPMYAYRMGYAIAEEGRAIGVHQNYAPVADVNNNPKNPIINVRSFSEDPSLVAAMSNAFIQGTQDGGMISTVKHFPGHGDTNIDSHNDLPTLAFDALRLDSIELPPFKSAVESGVMSVMLAHVSVPSIESDSFLPATLSHKIIDSLLREKIGFKGLIVTDAMNMKALTKQYSTGIAAVKAVQAGSDILLMPVGESAAIDSIHAAVLRGEIRENDINRSVRKILSTKEWLGLAAKKYTDSSSIKTFVHSREHQELAEEIARESITVIRNKDGMLPIKGTLSKKHLCLAFLSNGEKASAKYFLDELDKRGLDLTSEFIENKLAHGEIRKILKRVKNIDELIIASFRTLQTASGGIHFSEDQQFLLDKLALQKKGVIFVSFGSPYICQSYPSANAIVVAYSDALCSIRAAAAALFAEISPKGQSPVSIPNIAAIGTALSFPAAISDEEVLKLAEENDPLHRVDALINAQIRDHAFPGAVLLVQENGIQRYMKSYGSFTYDSTSTTMSTNTMFDLASISKVISTTSCAMKLYEEGKLHLDSSVASYLHEFAKNGKEKITIRNLLLHNSGLAAFRLYYSFCKNGQQLLDTLYRERLEYETGTKMVYSDLGMITLAKVIEKITGMGLDEYARESFFKPLGLNRTMYAPPESLRSHCAPTELDNYWRKRLVQGTVHDEAAALLDGVAGHAGLFSTAPELGVMLQMLMNGGVYNGKRYLKKETISLFTRRQSRSSSRALGWDTPSYTGSSAGKYFSPNSFGHTGFTGTSVWVDPVKKIFVIFLTNRVYPTRENKKLISFRPVLHDTVMEVLMGR